MAQAELDRIKGDTEWTEAEEQLIDEAHTGVVFFSRTCPEAGDETAASIRAPLIRHLLSDSCDALKLPIRSVKIVGARITGALDLIGFKTHRDLNLHHCRFDAVPDLTDAELGGLYLPGCALPGLESQRLRTQRDVHLRAGFVASGTVDLGGARISGQLACISAQLDGQGGKALNGHAMQVGVSVFLRDGFAAKGLVDLGGARISGQLSCTGARLDGQGGKAFNAQAMQVENAVFLRDGFKAKGLVDLRGARISGQLDCTGAQLDGQGGKALTAQAMRVENAVFLRNGFTATGLVDLAGARVDGTLQCQAGDFQGGFNGEAMQVEDGFFWHDLAGLGGAVDLTDAQVGRLKDDAQSWARAKTLRLSGFRYDRIDSDMSIGERLKWLSQKEERFIAPAFGEEVEVQGMKLHRPTPWIRGAYQPYCDPKPYTHLASVLRRQGMAQGAARVLEERDRRVKLAALHRARAQLDGSTAAGFAAIKADLMVPVNWLFRWVFGYGHAPARALIWVGLIWVFSAVLFQQVWERHQMAPTSDVVLTSLDWISAVEAYEADPSAPLPLAVWKDSPAAQDYETFNAVLYAADVFIPLDALGQEAAWAPSPVRGGWGTAAFYLKPVIQFLGWLMTAVGAAALTGLVGRRD